MSSLFSNKRARRGRETMENVYDIAPTSSVAFTTIWIIAGAVVVVLIGLVALLGNIAYQSRHAQFTISDAGLKIGPGVYGRFIPRDQVRADGVKVVDLKLDKEYALAGKTNGSNLPGFNSGWFKLKNGEKALVFVTDQSRVVYIPTSENYSVLLSTLRAEEMAGALRAWR